MISLSYIAGLIDADGSISISKRSASGGRYTSWAFVVNFRQLETARSTIEELKALLGAGSIYDHTGGGTLKMLSWQTTRIGEAQRVCEILLPHLIIKSRQAQEMLRAIDLWNQYKVGKISRVEADSQIEYIARNMNVNNQTSTYRENHNG